MSFFFKPKSVLCDRLKELKAFYNSAMINAAHKKVLQSLFERPLEPVFITRPNDNGGISESKNDILIQNSETSTNFSDKSKNILQSRYEEDDELRNYMKDLTEKPDLSFVEPLGRKCQFSLFQSAHQRISGQIIQILLDSPNIEHFIATSIFVKSQVNPFLFQYCYGVAVQHRKDTEEIPVMPIAQVFPHNFIEPSVFKDARGNYLGNANERQVIKIPKDYTASELEVEQRLAYFREDIGVNSHHWHWHLVYPYTGPREIVAKDRRGELFYYMHHQIIARYNVERFCNQLSKLKALNNLRDPIPEGYFPKILYSPNNRSYPGRGTNITLRDIDRVGNSVEIADVERWTDRIVQAIDQGYVTDSFGVNIPLDDVGGIDILGNIIEASDLSINHTVYGNLHNSGHNIISYSHDPDNRFLEEFSVMGDVSTAMRDPIFYRWHCFIDSIFNRHKSNMTPYENNDLNFNGISVLQCDATVIDRDVQANTLLTYWENSDVDLNAGLDFGPQADVYASFTHLQHAPFEYNIQIKNSTGSTKKGTCRIFLCPKIDEHGAVLSFNEQRMMAIELDKFVVTLEPHMNNITQMSTKSSVTIPYERSFRRVGRLDQPIVDTELAKFQFCGCGWPQHMLLPKGKPEGVPFDLFVMISDYTDDVVQQAKNTTNICNDSVSFCGLKDKYYPDRRSMGFPFDRSLQADSLKTWTTSFSNMIITEVVILFNNVIIEKSSIQ